jgi:hypothetical protein
MLLTFSRFGVLLWDPLQNPGGLAIEGSSGLHVDGQKVGEGWHKISGVFTFGYPELELGGWGDADGPEVVVRATGLIDPSGLDTFWIPQGPEKAELSGDLSRWRWTPPVRAEFYQNGTLQEGLASSHIDNSQAIQMVAYCPQAGDLRDLAFIGMPLPGRTPIKMPGQTLEVLQRYSQDTLARDPHLQKMLGCRGSGGQRL